MKRFGTLYPTDDTPRLKNEKIVHKEIVEEGYDVLFYMIRLVCYRRAHGLPQPVIGKDYMMNR